MQRKLIVSGVLMALGLPLSAHAADDADIRQLRKEMQEMKKMYEKRIEALEKKVARQQPVPVAQAAPQPVAVQADPQSAATQLPVAQAAPAGQPSAISQSAPVGDLSAATSPASGVAASSNPTAFNPAISMILTGNYANLSQDPNKYHISGFQTPPDVGPGSRGFNLGESELGVAANIDPYLYGNAIVAITPDGKANVEEGYVQTIGLANGITAKFGRFFSGIGYQNQQHAHVWDFADAPLAYNAFLGGQFHQDGAQVRYVLPNTGDKLVELGAELGRGQDFPGSENNRNGAGAAALFGHVGGDVGESISYRAGLSLLHTSPNDRTFTPFDAVGNPITDATGNPVTDSFNGRSNLLIADGVLKWAPGGNPLAHNFKLQGEYFRRKENGILAASDNIGPYSSAQSGWYAQGVYQFMPRWRVGYRRDQLYSGNVSTLSSDLAQTGYNPSKDSVMVDFTPTEFSRFRLQFARDRSRQEAPDNQVFFQYITSLGAHGAHIF